MAVRGRRFWPLFLAPGIFSGIGLLHGAPPAPEPITDPARSYNHIYESYPAAAYFGGGFSAFFSALAMGSGANVTRDPDASGGERSAGYALMLLGAVRFGDGLYRIFTETDSLRDARLFRAGTLENPEQRLLEHAASGRAWRYYRAHGILATGLAYAALGLTGKIKYDKHGQAGGFLIGLAVFQYLRDSPEEAALRAPASGTSVEEGPTVEIRPTAEGLGFSIRFRF